MGEEAQRTPSTATALQGRVAVVTGAGNGIGRAIATTFAAAGADVVFAGRDRGKLETAAAEARGEHLVATVDVTSAASVAKFAHELGRWVSARHSTPPSILVNNAGIAGPVAALPEITPEEWDEVFAVNVRGTYLMCRAFLPAMLDRGFGDVINLASVSGKRPLAGRTPYTASKMAVIGLTTTLAHEVGPRGVKVNTLSPGPVDGPRMDRNFRREATRTGRAQHEVRDEFVSRSALQRMVTEQEVADAALGILAMDGLTGADIDLSAGMVAR